MSTKIIDGKCIVKWGPQNQLRNYIEDPEFTETVINPRARSFIRGILADGGLDLPARQNRDQSVFDTATNLLHNNFFMRFLQGDDKQSKKPPDRTANVFLF